MKKIKFKKFLVLFSLLICVFCMTACSSSNGTISTASAKTELKQQQLDASEAYLVDWAKDMITYLDKNDSAKITADAEAAQSLTMVNNKLYIVDQSGISVKTIAFYNSWNSTRDELGALKSINEINVELNSKTGELCTITVDTSYEKNDKCTFEFVINDDYTLENGAINPSYTTGQKMYKAVWEQYSLYLYLFHSLFHYLSTSISLRIEIRLRMKHLMVPRALIMLLLR